ncbi:hypothetical protein [Parerythrobacter lacustris]|uniref:ATP-binding protein n=1 Tax=Parerythrobacter lacustris TaxID=2969984 RepID=A0ABT1XRL0_9SPHN|nr:hypothetical protein [Parerythrobacter lacustris]MCR2833310.1 hypothetical protein [Parerythrobacter lacustris]
MSFIDALHARKHVSVFGASKTGKSSLIEKQVGINERLYVQCSENFTVEQFNDALLEAIYGRSDVEKLQESEVATTRTTEGGIRVNSTNILASFRQNFAKNDRTVFRITDKKIYDLDNLGDCRTLFQDISHSRDPIGDDDIFLIIDDFHKASRKTQRWLANVAKMLFDNTRVVFIFVGVWVEDKILTALCPELSGRVEDINCNIWSKDDLLQVVLNGCDRLNIRFPDGFAETVVRESNGSVYILQEACKEACKIAGIREKSADCEVITKDLNGTKIVKETALKHCNFTDVHGELLNVDRDNRSILFIYHAMISRNAKSSPLIDMQGLQKRIETNFSDLNFDKNFSYNACVKFGAYIPV